MTTLFRMPSAEGIKERMKSERFVKAEYLLLLSIIAFTFIPSINQLIVDRFITDIGGDVLEIAGQIEWFDLFNETILAFLTVPMYFVFNRAKDDEELSSRINTTFLIGMALYTLVSVVIYIYASNLTAYMDAPAASVNYLRLETIGFVIGFVSSYLFVLFVVRGKKEYFITLLIAKVAMLSIGNSVLIPEHGVTGVALTNILVNTIIAVVSVILLQKEKLLRKWKGLDKPAIKDWVNTGIFSGGQVLVANIIYTLVVMKMVNEVSQMGNYWLANNFIWGWLIVPVAAIGEMLKREFYRGYRRIWNYLALTTLVLVIWLISVPFWNFMFSDIIVAEDPSAITHILYLSVPFYVAYAYSVILQAVLISVGKTRYIFYECLIVNFVYYGIVYGLYLAGVFKATMEFIILMFGIGLVVCLAIDAVLYIYSMKDIPEEPISRDAA
ncbi:MAG: hypothetical protein SPJ57_03125 [Candidatus Methanomethylophilaceae archaeon]|nr:hypothetical protein [Candidatus Methanomethylophilaceae archaeon]